MQKLNNELELGRVDVKTTTQSQNWKEATQKMNNELELRRVDVTNPNTEPELEGG